MKVGNGREQKWPVHLLPHPSPVQGPGKRSLSFPACLFLQAAPPPFSLRDIAVGEYALLGLETFLRPFS